MWKIKGIEFDKFKVAYFVNNLLYLTEILSVKLLQIVITYLSPKTLLVSILSLNITINANLGRYNSIGVHL